MLRFKWTLLNLSSDDISKWKWIEKFWKFRWDHRWILHLLFKWTICTTVQAFFLHFYEQIYRINQFNLFFFVIEKKSPHGIEFFPSSSNIDSSFTAKKGREKKIQHQKKFIWKTRQERLYNVFYILKRDNMLRPCVWMWIFQQFEFSILSKGRSSFLFLEKKADINFYFEKNARVKQTWMLLKPFFVMFLRPFYQRIWT